MAARSVSKVAPGEEKDVEAEETKAAPPRDQETTNRTPAKTPDEDTIRATLHRLATREPHSFHQTTIYYGLMREDTPPRRKQGLLATSIGIVFLQCFVASGFAIGVNLSTCSEQQRTIIFCHPTHWLNAQAKTRIAPAAISAMRGCANGAKVNLSTVARQTRRKNVTGTKKGARICAPRARRIKGSRLMGTLCGTESTR